MRLWECSIIVIGLKHRDSLILLYIEMYVKAALLNWAFLWELNEALSFSFKLETGRGSLCEMSFTMNCSKCNLHFILKVAKIYFLQNTSKRLPFCKNRKIKSRFNRVSCIKQRLAPCWRRNHLTLSYPVYYWIIYLSEVFELNVLWFWSCSSRVIISPMPGRNTRIAPLLGYCKITKPFLVVVYMPPLHDSALGSNKLTVKKLTPVYSNTGKQGHSPGGLGVPMTAPPL